MFTKTEIPAAYMGGASAWNAYLLPWYAELKKLTAEEEVVVQCIVLRDSSVMDIKVLANNVPLQRLVLRVFCESGKWIPAIQNGHQVTAYKKVLIDLKELKKLHRKKNID